MTYRIRVGKVDSAGDIPVMLEQRVWRLPVWSMVERTWIYSVRRKDKVTQELEVVNAKAYMRARVTALSNPAIKPHVEVLSDV